MPSLTRSRLTTFTPYDLCKSNTDSPYFSFTRSPKSSTTIASIPIAAHPIEKSPTPPPRSQTLQWLPLRDTTKPILNAILLTSDSCPFINSGGYFLAMLCNSETISSFVLEPIRQRSGTGSFCDALCAECACPCFRGPFSKRLLMSVISFHSAWTRSSNAIAGNAALDPAFETDGTRGEGHYCPRK